MRWIRSTSRSESSLMASSSPLACLGQGTVIDEVTAKMLEAAHPRGADAADRHIERGSALGIAHVRWFRNHPQERLAARGQAPQGKPHEPAALVGEDKPLRRLVGRDGQLAGRVLVA